MSGWLTESTILPRKSRPTVGHFSVGAIRLAIASTREKRGKKRTWDRVEDRLAHAATGVDHASASTRTETEGVIPTEKCSAPQKPPVDTTYATYLASLARTTEGHQAKPKKRTKDKKRKRHHTKSKLIQEDYPERLALKSGAKPPPIVPAEVADGAVAGSARKLRPVVDDFGRRSKQLISTVSSEYLQYKASKATAGGGSGLDASGSGPVLGLGRAGALSEHAEKRRRID